jgi:hypothetical protein
VVTVLHLNAKTTKQELEDLFSKFGDIININLDTAKKSASIYFDNLEQARQAASQMNQKELHGNKMQTSMKQMLERADFHDINTQMFLGYEFLIELLLDQLRLLGLRSENQDLSDEKYWQIFEHVNLIYELVGGVNTLREKISSSAEDKDDDKKKKKKEPKKQQPKKATAKKGSADKEEKSELPKLKTKKIIMKLIEALLNCGFVDRAKAILAEHPNLPELENLDEIEKRNHVELQFLYNSTYRSADDYLPSYLYTKKSRDKNFLQTLGFKPDPWQEQLMNHVDNKKSVLCTAPTSSGKTFIAFYAVEKVLRESDDGIVVFVFPTKALVNQAYAEVYSKFKKEYKNDKQKLLGILSGAERINVLNSQVLITLPAFMEVLLLNHTNIEWKKRLRYVVLDEIHSINSSEQGSVWEHVLLMINCPFLALSATVGNGRDFKDWLNKNKQNVELVEHNERPRPLEYCVYIPPEKDDSGSFCEVHPCAVLNPYKVDEIEIASMPPLSPKQLLDLYHTAESCASSPDKNLLKDFDPATYKGFQSTGIIPRGVIHEYSLKIREHLIALSKNPDNHPQLLKIFGKLRKGVNKAFNNIYQRFGKRIDDLDFLMSNFAGFIDSMHSERLLPTLIFVFDRNYIPKMLKTLLTHVKKNKRNLWYSDLQRNKSLNEIRITVSELQESPDADVDDYILDALNYGIACHYTNMDDTYQKEVERLYRLKHIPVLICTGTLALGIHMPCKSVTIFGYNPYLHSNGMFTQCSGRAGRRGFDIKGTVCLYGIPQANMDRLMTSPPTKLMGSSGLSPTFILRMMNLYHSTATSEQAAKTNNVEFVTDECIRLVNQPAFYLGDNTIDTSAQLKHHLRFSLEFLLREDLLSPEGAPGQHSGLLAHMAYLEPSNFILNKFIKSGLMHKLAMQQDLSEDARLEQLLHILCYLFARRNIYPTNIFARVLPSLPDEFVKVAQKYNEEVLQVYKNYVVSYSKTCTDKVNDLVLPVSKLSFIGRTVPSGDIAAQLDKQKIIYHSCSSYVALSGNGDDYKSIEQLLANMKHTIYLESLPTLNLTDKPLNSFVLDFFKHGTYKRVSLENQFFSTHRAKRRLEEMSRGISSIMYAIGEHIDFPQNDELFAAIKLLQRRFYERVVGHQFLMRKRERLAKLRVEVSDMDKYGPAETREDKRKAFESSSEFKEFKEVKARDKS